MQDYPLGSVEPGDANPAPLQFGWSRKRRAAAAQSSDSISPSNSATTESVEDDAVPTTADAPSLSSLPSMLAMKPQAPAPFPSNTTVEIDSDEPFPASSSSFAMSKLTLVTEKRTICKFKNPRARTWYREEMAIPDILQELDVNADTSVLYRYCRSLSTKERLLDAAIATYGSDISQLIILYIRESSTEDVFVNVLTQNPAALKLYCNYLNSLGEYKRLLAVYQRFNARFAEGKLLMREAFKQPDPRKRVSNLRYSQGFFNQYKFGEWSQVSGTAASLLERQIRIEEFDAKVAERGEDWIYRRYPPQSIVFASVAETVYYNEFYHATVPAGKLSSPVGTARDFDVSEKKRLWLALRARGMLQDWDYLRQLTEKRGMFSIKHKSKIGFNPFVEVCHMYGAPQEVMHHFIMLIKDKEERIKIASQYQCYGALIETFLEQRDYGAMQELLQFLDGDFAAGYLNGVHRGRILELMQNSEVKWKNVPKPSKR